MAKEHVERLAIQAGKRRLLLMGIADRERRRIVNLLDAAQAQGVSVTRFAQLTGIPRQTLYKWKT